MYSWGKLHLFSFSINRYRFTTPAKSVHWDVEWEVTDDSMLVVGIYEYGLGSWETIKADPKLALSKVIIILVM